ncbi:MAG: hypothetical protein EZS26_002255 [Candidatus Ordinivivax streblomastigis]|uniref:Uncharacterized protein n=1 Tax=Candidatus Ordinivivax streblomastigis TaxID=2540710 RepID=A0A5M8NZC5_9BACT|nr:MAG: hypothetical protein EZS26_002255 [Candidatus Ordinivivax streblomastigis]
MRNKKGWEILANWLVDISKYLMTGILLTSIFKDFESKTVLYAVSFLISVGILIIGILIKNKED